MEQLPQAQNNNSSLALKTQSKPLLAKLNENYPKVKYITDVVEFDNLINYLVTILNLKASSEQESNDLNIQMLVILDFIKSKFNQLTIEEIKEAFKMYVAKEFSDLKVFRMLDCVVVGEVLNEYINFRNESLKVYDQKKQSQTTETKMSEQEIFDLMTKAVNDKFLEFKLTNDIKPPFTGIFKELIERGIIKMPTSETPKLSTYYDKKLLEATELVKKEIAHESTIESNKLKRNGLKSILDSILNSEYNQDAKARIEITAKKLVLIDFFNKQVELNKETIL